MIKMTKDSTFRPKKELGSQQALGYHELTGNGPVDDKEATNTLAVSGDNLTNTPELLETPSNQVDGTRKARLKYNEANGEIVINLGDIVDWNVLTADAREILKSFDDKDGHSKPEDKQKILMSLCTLFGWPTSIIASSKSPSEDEIQAERSDVEAALDKFDSLDRPEISSSRDQTGEDEDEE